MPQAELAIRKHKNIKFRKIFTLKSSQPFLALDLLIVLVAYIGGVRFSPWASQIFDSNEVYFTAAAHALTVLVVSLGLGYYSINKRYRLFNILANSFLAHVLGIIISIGVTYIGFYTTFGRLGTVYGGVTSFVVLASLKLILRLLILNSPIKVAVSGDSKVAGELKTNLSKKGHLFRAHETSVDVNSPEETIKRLIENRISLVVVSAADITSAAYIDFHFKAADYGIDVVSDLEFYASIFERYPLEELTKERLVAFGFLKSQPLYDLLKRLLDIVLGSIGLLLASPLLISIAILIKLTSKGPVFFNQPRMGRRLKPFKMYKFRTMKASESKQDASGGFTKAGDSRVTWIGKIIRPLHFDELPQILNIIKGDMSIVGVRPEAESFATKMKEEIPFYYLRYMSRPGLTGHAQISMGYALDTVDATKDKLSYDFYYLTKKSILNDLRIILQTAFFLTSGAR